MLKAGLVGGTVLGALVVLSNGTPGVNASVPPGVASVGRLTAAQSGHLLRGRHNAAPRIATHSRIPSVELNAVVRRSCQRCHNATTKRGNLSLEGFNVDSAARSADVAERVIAKLTAVGC